MFYVRLYATLWVITVREFQRLGQFLVPRAAWAAEGDIVRTAKWTILTYLRKRITEERKAQLLTWHGQWLSNAEDEKAAFIFPASKRKLTLFLARPQSFMLRGSTNWKQDMVQWTRFSEEHEQQRTRSADGVEIPGNKLCICIQRAENGVPNA